VSTVIKVETMKVKSLNEVATSLWLKARQLRIHELTAQHVHITVQHVHISR